MKNKRSLPLVLFSTLIITVLFHKQALGLNLIIYESIFISWLTISKQLNSNSRSQIICGIGLIVSLIFTLVSYSIFAYIIHFISLFVFIGTLIYPDVRSLINAFILAFNSSVQSQIEFFEKLGKNENGASKSSRAIRKLSIFLAPLVIIIVFILIYKASNPVFGKVVANIGDSLRKALTFVFHDFDFLIVLTFIIGLFISSFLLLWVGNKWIIQKDLSSNDKLIRIRTRKVINFRFNALLNEYKAGLFLLFALNGLILLLNCFDLYWVWFNFEWEGQYLKQFVHEGTYLLILSILISIAVVLFFFRGNLNFYKNNKLLKYLSFAWLAQNGFLAISVAIRNFLYISHFSLAYKRIGVFIFLILTIIGLLTVLLKVRNQKSTFYLFRINSYALLIVLILSSVVNWDSFIAKYNFKHAETSFLHLDFLATLSDKALPYLDKPLEELNHLNLAQKDKYKFKARYMTPSEYYAKIAERKTDFILKWEKKSILSWNYPEYSAYKRLIKTHKKNENNSTNTD